MLNGYPDQTVKLRPSGEIVEAKCETEEFKRNINTEWARAGSRIMYS